MSKAAPIQGPAFTSSPPLGMREGTTFWARTDREGSVPGAGGEQGETVLVLRGEHGLYTASSWWLVPVSYDITSISHIVLANTSTRAGGSSR